MSEVANKLLFEKVSPNKTMVEEALSFNAANLDSAPDNLLRKYMVVLGQYLITLKYEENKIEAISHAWQTSLDARVYRVIQNSEGIPSSVKTVAEKRAWAVNKDEEARSLNGEFELADAQCGVIRNMHKPVEQYINTLKKEIDARENDKRRSGV